MAETAGPRSGRKSNAKMPRTTPSATIANSPMMICSIVALQLYGMRRDDARKNGAVAVGY